MRDHTINKHGNYLTTWRRKNRAVTVRRLQLCLGASILLQIVEEDKTASLRVLVCIQLSLCSVTIVVIHLLWENGTSQQVLLLQIYKHKALQSWLLFHSSFKNRTIIWASFLFNYFLEWLSGSAGHILTFILRGNTGNLLIYSAVYYLFLPVIFYLIATISCHSTPLSKKLLVPAVWVCCRLHLAMSSSHQRNISHLQLPPLCAP